MQNKYPYIRKNLIEKASEAHIQTEDEALLNDLKNEIFALKFAIGSLAVLLAIIIMIIIY